MMGDIVLTSTFWILGLGGVLLLVADTFFKGQWPRALATAVVLVGAVGAPLATSDLYVPGLRVFYGMVHADTFALFTGVLLVLGALMVIIMGLNRVSDEGIEAPGEYYALLLMSTAGAVLFANASELITMFLGLEILSMALYCLCGSATSRRESSESSLKYFLLGSFSSAFLLYGIALLYGLTGTTMVPELAAKIGAVDTPMLYFALGLLLIGFVFKIGAVPFHFWAPDVYEGAPTSVTGYMACIVKASAIAATMRVLWGIFPGLFDVWVGFVWMVALLTMIVGNLLALRQQSVKRMLAYSSIAHAGYLMVGFLAPGGEYGGGAAMLFYLISYTAMTLGAFGVVLAVSGKYAGKRGADDLMTFNGLGYTNPFLAVVMSLFMLGLAGLPPSLAGLVGKVYLFSAAVKAGFLGIAIVGMIASCISCYYYLRVIVAMYFKEPVASESEAASREDTALAGVLGLCAVAVVVLGISPSYVYDLARSVMLSF